MLFNMWKFLKRMRNDKSQFQMGIEISLCGFLHLFKIHWIYIYIYIYIYI